MISPRRTMRREFAAGIEICTRQTTRRYSTRRYDRNRSVYLSRAAHATAIAAAATLLLQNYGPRSPLPFFADYLHQCDSSERFYRWGAQAPIIEGRKDTKQKKADESAQHNTDIRNASDGQSTTGNPEPPDQRDSQAEARGLKWPGFASIGDKITDLLVPDWVKLLPGFITKLQNEMSLAPGSLAEQIWWEAHDPEVNPEIAWDASVRVSADLCDQEKQFLHSRRVLTRTALAKYLGLKESDVHPEDVPTIAMCGSGGGLRALVAGTSSYLSAHESGLFDCVTYTAGVSGSCWLQTLFYSSITDQSHQDLIRHLKNRLGVHIAFPPAALSLLNSAPTNKFLLSGVVEKLKGTPDADFGIVDVYGLLLAARLLVPKGELAVHDGDLKVSNQKQYIDSGKYPLPIYTAVRHEIPFEEQDEPSAAAARARAKREAWFQWFEMTPYEFFCEEFEAGIPTWAMGRNFEAGKTVWRDNGLALPETRVPLMMGIWGSAFCATLSHYYKEIRPVMKSLAGFGGIDSLIAERDEALVKIHPIDPATIPNFVRGLEHALPPTVPESVFSSKYLQLMDAGMSNNLPIYPLLRPGRDVDIVIAFDASADVKQDNWLKEVDGYAKQRNIKGWPMGAGWPPSGQTQEQVNKELDKAQSSTEKQAQTSNSNTDSQGASDPNKSTNKGRAAGSPTSSPTDLGFCNIWVGSTADQTPPSPKPDSKNSLAPKIPELITHPSESDTHHPSLTSPTAGITVIYFPFLPNPSAKGIDPQTSDFMSTWNFIYTPEQIEAVVSLAKANWKEGEEQTKRTVRAVYERKKKGREERERAARKDVGERGRRAWLAGKGLGEEKKVEAA